MIKKKYILFFVLLQFLVVNTYGQKTVQEILDKSTQLYAAKDEYHIDMKFTMHRGLSGENPTESYEGSMQKKGNYIKNVVLTTVVHQFQNAKVIVDESTKTVIYEKLGIEAIQNAPLDLGSFLEYYKKSQVLDNGDEWICEMVSTQNNFAQVPYGKVIIHVDKKSYEIKKQVLFHTNRIPFKGKNGVDTESDFGRLVIDFLYPVNTVIEIKALDDFITKKSGNEIGLQARYADYQFIDQTEYNK